MQTSQPVSRWTLFFIIFYLAIPQIALDLYLPSIPSMMSALHGTATQVQTSLSIYLIAIALAQFFYGSLSDSFGRKPLVLIGCSLFIVGSLVCVLAQRMDVLLAGRFVQGLGFAFGSSLSRAILRDVVHTKKTIAKVVSLQSIAWSSVPLIAPVIGGYIQHGLSWRANFIVLLALGILAFTLSLAKLTETRLVAQRRSFHPVKILRTYWMLLARFRLVGYMIIIALQYGAVMTFLQIAPFIFQIDLGFSAYEYGWLILLAGLGSLIGAFANRTLSQLFVLKRIILVALIVAVLMSITMNMLALTWFNAVVIIVPILIMRIAGGLVYANCVAEGLAQFPEHAGSVSALYSIVISSGAAVITAIVAHLPQHRQWTLTLSLAVEMGLALIVFLLVLLRMKHAADTQLHTHEVYN